LICRLAHLCPEPFELGSRLLILNLATKSINLPSHLTPLSRFRHVSSYLLIAKALPHDAIDAATHVCAPNSAPVLFLLKLQVLPNEGLKMLHRTVFHWATKSPSRNLSAHGDAGQDARRGIRPSPYATRV